MANKCRLSLALLGYLLVLLLSSTSATKCRPVPPPCCKPIPATDIDRVQFAMNLEFLEAEFFLHGAFGKGLDSFAPYLARGGPSPFGGKKARLDPFIQRVIEELGYEEIGHLRAIYERVGGIQRPFMNISTETFGEIFDKALDHKLVPLFDPYSSPIHYLLASYLLPYVGLTGYVGSIPLLCNFTTKDLVGRLLGVESGQDAIIRTMLYEHAGEKVEPYGITVAEITNKLSWARNELGKCRIKDEGVIVPKELGAEGKTRSNVLSANKDSLAYSRTPQEIARIVYGSGNEHVPGGFYPRGANGKIAWSFLYKP